jgi:Ni/Co efflux regulator RcnB
MKKMLLVAAAAALLGAGALAQNANRAGRDWMYQSKRRDSRRDARRDPGAGTSGRGQLLTGALLVRIQSEEPAPKQLPINNLQDQPIRSIELPQRNLLI